MKLKIKHDRTYTKQDASDLLGKSAKTLMQLLDKTEQVIAAQGQMATNLKELQKALLYLFDEQIENDTEWEKSTYE